MNDPTWNALLRWSIKQQSEDSSAPVSKPMSKEDAKWLQEALSSMVVDEAARLRLIVKVLFLPDSLQSTEPSDIEAIKNLLSEIDKEDRESRNVTEKNPTEYADLEPTQLESSIANKKELIFEELEDIICNLDAGLGFAKAGGMRVLLRCLQSPLSSVQWRAASAIAVLTQNQNYLQMVALNDGLMPWLAALVQKAISKTMGSPSSSSSSVTGGATKDEEARLSKDDELVVYKSLSALSAMVRGNDEAYTIFKREFGGPSLVIRAFINPQFSARIKRKAIFFLATYILSADTPEEADARNIQGSVTKALSLALPFHLAAAIVSEDAEVRENSVKALKSLLRFGGKQAKQACSVRSKEESKEEQGTDVQKLINTRFRQLKQELETEEDEDQKQLLKEEALALTQLTSLLAKA